MGDGNDLIYTKTPRLSGGGDPWSGPFDPVEPRHEIRDRVSLEKLRGPGVS